MNLFNFIECKLQIALINKQKIMQNVFLLKKIKQNKTKNETHINWFELRFLIDFGILIECVCNLLFLFHRQ